VLTGEASGADATTEEDVVGPVLQVKTAFPAIYGDLFEQQTFDPANGGWRYDVQPSYGLPDFSDGQ